VAGQTIIRQTEATSTDQLKRSAVAAQRTMAMMTTSHSWRSWSSSPNRPRRSAPP